ncbi:MAG: hypothetical protein ABWY03_00795 [Microbacterium sp.]
MHIAGTGRFVFITQWIAAVVLPAFFFVGRAFVGADAGWLAVLGIVYGFFVILLLLLPPLLTVFDRDVRKAKATRRWYDIATFVLWGAFLVASLTVPDAGDSGPVNSALTNWTNGLVTNDAAAVVCGIAGIVIGIAYLATFVLAIMGIARAGRAPAEPA